VQPAAHDAGTALVATLHLAHARPGTPRVPQASTYLGPEYGQADIDRAVAAASLPVERPADVLGRAVDLIADGRIVGWFQGALEFGPRALGNRSILADPRRADMKDRINLAVKYREPFRPFAATVLQEHQADWFEGAADSIVCSPGDAIRCFQNCGMEFLVLGKTILGKRVA
jgi:carbamoyltransferase